MEKNDLMKEYEIKIDSVVNWEANPIGYAKYLESELIKEREKPTITYQAVETFQEIIRNQCDEITALKEKAEAYDRMMSCGKKTLKEIANIFGAIVAMDESGRLHLFGVAPKVNENIEEWQPAYRSYYEKVPICDINFSGDWKDSLTLPDGWEEEE